VPYRHTEAIVRKLAARRDVILASARDLAAESGLAAVQIASVAEGAGIATGTVYRYFASKSDLVAALAQACAAAEVEQLRAAAAAAPGPLSALSAAIVTFALRAIRQERLAFALMVEPIESDIAGVRAHYRSEIVAEFASRIRRAIDSGHLPDQNVDVAAAAILGALVEGLFSPAGSDTGQPLARTLALMCLRALGIADARARGLVINATSKPAPAST
jgi:AcrR family transcriptional regulator